MASTPQPVSALGMLSGGLDSQLALCVVREQGVRVEAVVFESPFFDAARARKATAGLGIPLHVIEFTDDIVGLVKSPPHGFGKGMNPCLDCHARMIRRTGELADRLGFQFIFTGEVLNQRPMSQNRASLDVVAAESGYAGRLLRPLSAGLLPPTQPEREGWVDRARLLSLEGRSRTRQFELAAHYGIADYPMPAGGCRLTEPNFSRRLRELRDHEGLDDVAGIRLLRLGRHFRLGPRLKIVVGRSEEDNAAIEGFAGPGDWLLNAEDIPGPTVLVPGSASEDQLQFAASVAARYSDAAAGAQVTVAARSASGTRLLQVRAALPDALGALMV